MFQASAVKNPIPGYTGKVQSYEEYDDMGDHQPEKKCHIPGMYKHIFSIIILRIRILQLESHLLVTP